MPARNTIMIVDDNTVNRTMLRKILEEDYNIVEAVNGEEAFAMLEKNRRGVSAVLLDIVMPVMNGYEFLAKLSEAGAYGDLPVIVLTSSNDRESEIRALKLGAWDFVTKPYNSELISFRLSNAIERSQFSVLRRMKYMAEYDPLTGIFSRNKFLTETKRLLKNNPAKRFAFIRFDINRFSLINASLGVSAGDKTLKRIGSDIKSICSKTPSTVFGRMQNDVFCICTPDVDGIPMEFVTKLHDSIIAYNSKYLIAPAFGVYVVEDNDMEVNLIFDRANLAARKIKEHYDNYVAFYDKDLHDKAVTEQTILRDMNSALEKGEFDIYIQPKYDLATLKPAGGEALVRWIRSDGTVMQPHEFVPIFEKNGFITKIDRYVLETTCKMIRRWMDRGVKLRPVSVNMSRANIYNRNIVTEVSSVVDSYGVPHEFVNIELTESLYAQDPQAVQLVVSELQKNGFLVMMDDFGNAYSSLGILKDMTVDVLKIDMRFLSDCVDKGRAENIVASVVRMARWLGIQVIAEGTETVEQVNFLRSIGCDFVQGFFFDEPMTVRDYEEKHAVIQDSDELRANEKASEIAAGLFAAGTRSDSIFANIVDAAAIYEFDGDHIELLRVNNNFFELMGKDDEAVKLKDPISLIHEDDRERLLDVFRRAVKSGRTEGCAYRRKLADSCERWIRIKIRRISNDGDSSMLYGVLDDITAFHVLAEQCGSILNDTELAVMIWSFGDDRVRCMSAESSVPCFSNGFTNSIIEACSGSEKDKALAEECLRKLKNGESFSDVKLKLNYRGKDYTLSACATPVAVDADTIDNAVIILKKI